MRIKNLLLFAIALTVLSCNSKKEVSEGAISESNANQISNEIDSGSSNAVEYFSSEELKDTAVILRLNKSACYGECPIFNFELRKNGTAKFYGRGFVEYIGKYNIQLKSSEYLEVFKKAEEIDFYDLDEVYDASVTDVPSSTIYLNNGINKHETMLRFDIPEKAQNFDKWLTAWVLSLDWEVSKKEVEDK